MRILSVFFKSVREQLRDPLALSLSLVFAPIFVLLYALWFPGGSTSYGVLILSQDVPVSTAAGMQIDGAGDVIAALENIKYANGNPLLKVTRVQTRQEADKMLQNRDAAALFVLPPDFSRALAAVQAGRSDAGATVTMVGDLTNPYYAVAVALAGGALDAYIQSATGQVRAIQYTEVALGSSAARSEFENYVPGLFVFATMMLIFTTAIAVTREAEAGTLRRLKLTGITSFDLLGGISAALVLFAMVAVVLTFATALALGFRSQGPLWLAVVIGGVTALSIIGVGLVTACFCRNVTQAFLLANFPLALFMFFSGAVFPLPRVPLFTLAGHVVGLYDILPPTHAVNALNKVFTMGAGLGDVVFELTALCILSILYLGLGMRLFERTHLRVA